MIIVYNGTSTSQQKGVGAKPFPFNQLGGGRCKEAIIFLVVQNYFELVLRDVKGNKSEKIF